MFLRVLALPVLVLGTVIMARRGPSSVAATAAPEKERSSRLVNPEVRPASLN